MAYTTFTAAWNAWKAGYPYYLTEYVTLQSKETLLSGATTWQETRDYARSCIESLELMMLWISGYYSGGWTESPFYSCMYYAWKEGAPAAVTMAAILSAMLGAKFTELQDFIGIEDAYRVALWNAPFNANFYAALARGFIKWP